MIEEHWIAKYPALLFRFGLGCPVGLYKGSTRVAGLRGGIETAENVPYLSVRTNASHVSILELFEATGHIYNLA